MSYSRAAGLKGVAGALIVIQVVWWAVVALPGWFQLDDNFYFSVLIGDRPRLWDWLGRIYFDHFAPGHRLVYWILGSATPSAWYAVQVGFLALFAIGLVFFYKTLELLFGRSPWLLIPLALAGFAWPFALGFAWPAAGLHLIPAFACGTVATYGFLRSRASGGWRWMALSGLAFAVGLAFFIRMLLVPAGLVLIRCLFLERSLTPRALGRALWEDRARWLVFAVPAVLFLNYYGRHIGPASPRPSLDETVEFVKVAWARNLWPSLLGIRLEPLAGVITWPLVRPLPGWKVAVELGVQAALVVVVVASFVRKGRAAMRAWTYVVLVVGATFWLTARGRLAENGAGLGYDPRYMSDLFWQIPLGVVLAFHPRNVLEPGTPWPASARAPRRPLAGTTVAAALAVVVLAAHTSHTLERQRGGPRAHDWVDNVRAGLRELDARGRIARVEDGPVPDFVWPRTTYAQLLPLLGEPVRVGGAGGVAVRADGTLRRLP
jgi:hypothetical protein